MFPENHVIIGVLVLLVVSGLYALASWAMMRYERKKNCAYCGTSNDPNDICIKCFPKPQS